MTPGGGRGDEGWAPRDQVGGEGSVPFDHRAPRGAFMAGPQPRKARDRPLDVWQGATRAI